MTIDEAERPVSLDWLLDVRRVDRDLFLAPSPRYRTRRNLFGGQVAAQALWAAALSVEAEHYPHSFHLYFMRAGTKAEPVVLYVSRIRDGRSFTTRNVVAQQNGEAILTMSASFHRREPGQLDHQVPPALVPPPGTLGSGAMQRREQDGYVPIDVVPVASDAVGVDRAWMKLSGTLPDDPVVHACALAYMSDTRTAHAPIAAVGQPEHIMITSLDHALHYHRHVRADEWLLVACDAPSVGNGRGLSRATIHSAGGVLGATVQQELLMRELARDGSGDAHAVDRSPPDML